MFNIDILQETLNKINDSIIKSQVHVIVNPYLCNILLNSNDNNQLQWNCRNKCCYYKHIKITCDYDLAKNEILVKKLGKLDYEKIEIEYVGSKR